LGSARRQCDRELAPGGSLAASGDSLATLGGNVTGSWCLAVVRLCRAVLQLLKTT